MSAELNYPDSLPEADIIDTINETRRSAARMQGLGRVATPMTESGLNIEARPRHIEARDDPKAACSTRDESFFEDNVWASAAKNLCKSCPLKKRCLEDELDTPTTSGIRGGLNLNQRMALLEIINNGSTSKQRGKVKAMHASDKAKAAAANLKQPNTETEG